VGGGTCRPAGTDSGVAPAKKEPMSKKLPELLVAGSSGGAPRVPSFPGHVLRGSVHDCRGGISPGRREMQCGNPTVQDVRSVPAARAWESQPCQVQGARR
jgi:hypothetical protein